MLYVIGKEATNFVSSCEAIQSLLARGEILTLDDRALIVFSGSELLTKLLPA